MEHTILARGMRKDIYPSTLRLGGANPQGDEIGFTNYYMTRNGEPYFAICGEFHYSRYPREQWETEIRKMKMSGINVIPTYIFWNHHEEEEGRFEWEGDRNLRAFVELCGRDGVYVILRVGPFCHGEVRNGGLPDWLFGRSFDVRSNDEGYLGYVKRLYEEIGRQAAGLMFKDGGPVIGIQLENEFNASAALWELTAKQGDEYLSGGSGGEAHILRLKEMAAAAGLVAPIYSITGWGNAPVPVDEVLPLYGGYAYTPWTITARQREQKPTGEYLFTRYHDNAAMSRDFDPPYPKESYPFACCEMGGGMQTWYLARFQVEPESVAAMSLVKIASGCNFIGYYMFHGGTNPVGRTGYLNESSTPRITYDFQAPIGEFGQIRASNHLLRPLHYFLRRFGDRLAPMAVALPADADRLSPEDTKSLRYAVRTDGRSGFLFVNNYQDHAEMAEHADVRFAVELDQETVRFPRGQAWTIRRNASFFVPLHMDLDGLDLISASAQPVTELASEGARTYFFLMPEGVDGEFVLDGASVVSINAEYGQVERDADGAYRVTVPSSSPGMIRIRRAEGTEIRIYAMEAGEAAMLWEPEHGGERRILFSSSAPLSADGGLELVVAGCDGEASFREYAPAPNDEPRWLPAKESVAASAERSGWFTTYTATFPAKDVAPAVRRIHDHKVVVEVPDGALDSVDDLILHIGYTGNVGYAFSGGQLIHDHFHNGAPWELGLSRFRDRLRDGELVLETTPLRDGPAAFSPDAGLAAERNPEGAAVAKFHRITAEPVYRVAWKRASR
ncbi:beta-galactosidase [Paenibacillus methanolicus]|uniref:Beta-galactosidase n=1 Tax=Paenibacillus methanolicus TaxID=582686 RepID=A0A5S5C5Y1_9BACL|nr:beta-galactosidase [Paenibacillus methanolicus]TYP74579.1 glycosyl hydrolase family 35 [Paenibacillus methanolicus]